MYIARYSDGQESVVQTALRFSRVVFESPEEPGSWQASFLSAIRELAYSPKIDFAYRVSLEKNALHRLLMLMTSADRVDELRAMAGRFLRLNGLANESVEPCLDKEEHDEQVAAFPDNYHWVRSDAVTQNECQLVCDFSLLPLLDRLFDAALHRSFSFSVQFNVRRYQLTTEDRRALRKNLVQVNSVSGLPRRLADIQRRLVDKSDRASFLADQITAYESSQAESFLKDLITEEFRSKFGQLGFQCSPFAESNDGVDEMLATGFHSSLFEEVDPIAKAAQSLSPDDVEQLLNWQPSRSTVAKLLSNFQVGEQREKDFLKRIEIKLGELEQALQAHHRAAEECSELKKALSISRADPPFALVKTRQILEGIVLRVYRERKPGQTKPLFNMIDELLEDGRIFPRRIASYLHTLRVLGNLVAHGGMTKTTDSEANTLSESDVELVLLMTLNLVEWYLFEYSNPQS